MPTCLYSSCIHCTKPLAQWLSPGTWIHHFFHKYFKKSSSFCKYVLLLNHLIPMCQLISSKWLPLMSIRAGIPWLLNVSQIISIKAPIATEKSTVLSELKAKLAASSGAEQLRLISAWQREPPREIASLPCNFFSSRSALISAFRASAPLRLPAISWFCSQSVVLSWYCSPLLFCLERSAGLLPAVSFSLPLT